MKTLLGLVFVVAAASGAPTRTVVFWDDGFPEVEGAAAARETIAAAMGAGPVEFAGAGDLAKAGALDGAELLVMPYGSAFPVEAWGTVFGYLRHGGNLLVLGGRPFRAPVARKEGRFVQGQENDGYERALGIVNTYVAPSAGGKFRWREGYGFWRTPDVLARRVFVLEGRLSGLGYFEDDTREKRSAPVVTMERWGGRWVMLDFEPEAGYWDSAGGRELIRTAAGYARRGPSVFSVEVEFSTLRPRESPAIELHYRNERKYREGAAQSGEVQVELTDGTRTIGKRVIACGGRTVDEGVPFDERLGAGFYRVRAVYYEDGGTPWEFTENGFWVAEEAAVREGPRLGIRGDLLTRDGRPFLPFGTNYFSTEENGWDFSGPRNAAVWEDDFAQMERHGVNFVRTGVWGGQTKFLEGASGGASERFLRNVEAYLLCARAHHMAVNFNFFAFTPDLARRHLGQRTGASPGENPYLSPGAVEAEQEYILSLVERFKDVPYLSWDLINEPSFSNPGRLWHGNTPNRDADEQASWSKWLEKRYGAMDALAAAWSVPAAALGSFAHAALPEEADFSADMEHWRPGQARALDYNLFAQDAFSGWVREMVAAIRSTGSRQLIDVGQDEGGVENRVLNQFYASSGLSFTTNHTYRHNDALLWDSLAAKAPGVANITGETGYQPVILPNGKWQFDERSGQRLIERKWAMGFAAGSSGALSWDWDREIHFGIERSDGSEKLWEDQMREMGEFVRRAAEYAIGRVTPEIAIVLPQSLQLSTLGQLSIDAQQNCVRALYGYARGSAYVVGEYQIDRLGKPKLILLPSPWVLSESAWRTILDRVRNGATLVVTGRIDLGPHFERVGRANELGLEGYSAGRLMLRAEEISWPGGTERLTYSGKKTDYLERGYLANGKTFVDKRYGAGRILYVPLPVELADDPRAAGGIYQYAMQAAHVTPAYSTEMNDPDVLICPTRFSHATLYVIESRSATSVVSFRDGISGAAISASVEPGGAAMRLVGEHGEVLAAYREGAR
jgi:hypothetical protein